MAQKKSSSRNKAKDLSKIVEGEFRVPYFGLKSKKYVGVVAIVTEATGDIGNGLEATGLLDHNMEGKWEMFYRNNNHFGCYDITVIGVKRVEKDSIERRVGELDYAGAYKPKGLTAEQKSRLFVNGTSLSENAKLLLGGVIDLVENEPEKYVLTRRQAA